MREPTEMETLTGMIAPENPLLPPPACTCPTPERHWPGCPAAPRDTCTCLDGEWNPACLAHPPASECTCVGPEHNWGACRVHGVPDTHRAVRTPLRFPQRVSREDFDRAMRLLRADRSAEGLHLVTLHIEAGKIEATYAEIHRVGYIGEVGED